MNRMTRRTALAATAAALAAPALAQETPTAAPLRKAFRFLDTYLGLPPQQRDRFTMAYYLQQADERPPPAGTRVWVIHGGRRTELPLSPAGRIGHPTLAMLADKAAMVTVEKADPNVKLGLTMRLEASAAPAATMSAPELAAAIEQANQAIRRKAGVIGFAVPRMGRAVFVGAGSGEVVLADGRRAPLPLIEGRPSFIPAGSPGARTIVLARAPTRVSIAPAPKGRR